eukprot:7520948-Alexandrium_andersonii.AAC.1
MCIRDRLWVALAFSRRPPFVPRPSLSCRRRPRTSSGPRVRRCRSTPLRPSARSAIPSAAPS